LIGAAALALFACSKQEPTTTTSEVTEPPAVAQSNVALDNVLDALPETAKARFGHRHPKETIEFFGIEPGMTVVDTLPGEVWYTGILLDYLGPQGKVIGADYSVQMWSLFGASAPKPGVKEKWTSEFLERATAWRDEDDAQLGAVQYGNVSDELAGTADVVLLVRAIHHMMRFENQGGHLTQALADINKLLKPGGTVGVVAHRAPESSADAWATGEAGYVKQSAVIEAFKKAGFELADQSEINANPLDQPTSEDTVWRLPPRVATSKDDPELKAKMEAIGESDRMTLKFRKPA
jgi:predicted methyltransferase